MALALHRCSSLPETISRPFRLLHLLPGSNDDTVACRLFESSLDQETGKYEALSYVWGDISTRVPIQVNGGTFLISENLRNALTDLRFPDLPRNIWAGAICINQKDAAERVSQVRKRYLDDTTMVHVFMQPDWWLRVWTAQEILLARRATIVSGPCQISWDSFCAAVEHANTFGAFKFVVLGVIPRSEAWMVDDIRSLQRAPRLPNPADELLFYLLRTRARDATDARDRIFAVLGLVSGNTLDLGIQPDYGASVEDVYCEATRRLIVVSENLDVLGHCYPFDDERAASSPS